MNGLHPKGLAKRIIIGMSWEDLTPRVRLRDGNESGSTLHPAFGLGLQYRTSSDAARVCLGHSAFPKSNLNYVDCLAQPVSGSSKCRRCSVFDATLASDLHHAHTKDRNDIDPIVDEHLRQPNRLYIAVFRDGSLKVGTTTEGRQENRMMEQGAWRAIFVATVVDGYLVREVEDKVTAELGFAQSVSIRRKLDGMVQPKVDTVLESSLESAAELVLELIHRAGDDRIVPTNELWEFPNSGENVWSGLHRYPLRLASGSHALEVQAMCGRVVVVAQPGSSDAFVADLGELFGVELEVGCYDPDPLVVQDSLF